MKKIIVILCLISLIMVPSTMTASISKKTKLSQNLEPECTTLVSAFGYNGSTCNVTEFDSEGNIIWQLTNLSIPQDAERLPNGNTLIVIHGDESVIEVDKTGKIIWQFLTGKGSLPVDAERLPNGNTLIAQYGNGRVKEVDNYGNIIWEMTDLHKPFDAERLPNGNTLIVEAEQYPDGRVFEVDNDYNEFWSISGLDGPVDAERLYNETYDNYTTLITEHIGRNVTEYNENKEIVWQKTGLLMPKDAERLDSGNTLIAECGANRVITILPNGEIVGLISDLQYPVDVEYLCTQQPPIIEITNPKEGYFHIRDRPLFPFGNKTFVYGPTHIKANITSSSEIEKVEFYINDKLEETIEGEHDSYEYKWAPIRCGRYTIKTIVYNIAEQNASDTIALFKWRAHPILILTAFVLLFGM